ncbi:phage tail protein [Serratia fonticola]|uniref:phage tail terminator protein n=1 Tax=Serratia fonticola TaxID=47917 RepID=UPI00164947AF|nr:phage tail terminator protein [Serratia fonticola]MBC3253509.1 phage tail protein [Serratia fonticola]
MIIHSAIRKFTLNALEEKIPEVVYFDGRPAVLDVEELPAIAVYLTDILKNENYLDGEQWGAVLHVELFLKAQTPDSIFDEWMEKYIYPIMKNIPALEGLIESFTPIGYEYRRDEELATWGSSDLMYSITYLK